MLRERMAAVGVRLAVRNTMASGVSRCLVSRRAMALAALVLACAVPATSFAQAWLPARGEGSVSIGVQIFHVRWHLEFDGSEQEEADLRIKNVTTEATYGLTDRIALDFGIPYVASRFAAVAHPCPEPVLGYLPCAFPESEAIDSGKYYGTLQDFRLNVRYAMWSRGLALTPSLAVVVPSHAYETHGHAAPGRHLRELGLGLNAGRPLPRVPNSYVHASYVYTLAQRLVHKDLDLRVNRSNAEYEVGHQFTPALTVRGFGSWQRTHGGLEWTDDLVPGSAHEEIHDQAARASYWRLGAGVVYSLNESLDINVSILTTMSGKNTHKVGGVIAGTTWTFGRGSGVLGVPSRKSRRPVVGG
jgi:hypothetical protein